MPKEKYPQMTKSHRRGVQCNSCLHKKNLRDSFRVQCCHPKVIEIQNEFPERKPGYVLACALNKMGKALTLRINPDAYKDRWFNWPFCYNATSMESCSGFEKKAESEAENKNPSTSHHKNERR